MIQGPAVAKGAHARSMTLRAIVLCACTAVSSDGFAQPSEPAAAQPAEPLARPQLSLVRAYTTFGVAVGGMSEGGEENGRIMLLHGSLGIQYGHPMGANYRLGASLDAFSAYDQSVAAGIEAQIDRPVSQQWRLGGRGSLGFSFNQERVMWIAGARARHQHLSVGLDVLGFGPSGNGSRGHTVGMMGSLGVEGRAAKYTLAVGAIGGLILGGLALVALSGTH